MSTANTIQCYQIAMLKPPKTEQYNYLKQNVLNALKITTFNLHLSPLQKKHTA